MTGTKRWQDWVNLGLGVWLFFSPFFMDYVGGTGGVAAWNSYLLGLGVAIFAASALARPAQWEEWVNLALGAWLVIAPWVLGFAAGDAAVWNHLIVGLLVGGDALWAMLRARHQHAYG